MSDRIEKRLQRQVLAANSRAQPLCIVGGASKSFYGREAGGTPIHTAAHKGVVQYDPSELVITARAGTKVAEVEELLALKNQMLGFEPPRFADTATIGGAVAAGLAGPRRPYAGAVRDFILGVKILNGKGEIMRFGGQVMKNVAGFDIARLMAGSMGTLGILLEVSLRIIPQAPTEKTVLLEHPDPADAIEMLNRLAARPLPLSAAAWSDGQTRIRLSGSATGVTSAVEVIGGEIDSGGRKFWQQLRDHQLPFFRSGQPLLRVSVPPATAMTAIATTAAAATSAATPPTAAAISATDTPSPATAINATDTATATPIFANAATPTATAATPPVAQLIDWGGAQRWLVGEADPDALREAAARHGGHLTHFRHTDRQGEVFHPLTPPVNALNTKLKRAFDPSGILNPGRLYRDF